LTAHPNPRPPRQSRGKGDFRTPVFALALTLSQREREPEEALGRALARAVHFPYNLA
jgi:hypothetical protein